MKKFKEPDFKEEIKQLEQKMNELKIRKKLLEEVVNNIETASFNKIEKITKIKEIYETKDDYDAGLVVMEERYYYEVKTDTCSFLIMVDYLGEQRNVFYEYFFYDDVVYRIYSPMMEKDKMDEIVAFLENELDKEKSETTSVQFLHVHHPEYKKRELSKAEKKDLKKKAVEYEKEMKVWIDTSFEELLGKQKDI